MTLADDQTVSAASPRAFRGGKTLVAALLRTTALLGPSMILGYARAYAQTVCSQSPSGSVNSGTSFTCDIPTGTQAQPQVFYTGYGMWYSGRNKDSQPGLPITITNNAEINVTGDFVSGGSNSQASNYAPALPTSAKAGPRGEISSISGGLLAFNVGSDNLDSGNDVSGGAGAAVTVTSNASITATGFGIAVYSAGGHGSKAGTASGTAGDGGSGGAVTISVLRNVSAGTGPAVFGASYGGGGGRTGKLGRGGGAGAVTLSFANSVTSVTSQNTGALFQSPLADPIVSGSAAAAISYGGDAYRDDGGNASNVSITAFNAEGTRFTAGGASSPAIFARSYGGVGNASGYAGGTAGNSTVTLSGTGTVTTTGASAPGIVAQSMGGAGQSKDVTSTKQTAATGGVAGNASASNSFTISTTGSQSHGIVAQSAGAGGGLFNYTGAGDLTWGDQNVSSGKGANVVLSNSGAISTAGADANGIVAQSIGGGGGHVGIDANAGTTTVGGASDSVSGNAVTVANSGDITTLGQSASSGGSTSYGGGIAIVAQSIGGGGGTMAGGHGQIGGKGTGSTGGAVSVTNAGATLSTAGADAHGVLAQSIGGGGGQGRNSTGLFVAVGGTGGSGGTAGTAAVSNSGAVLVSGDYANGVMVQSIGGGGGTGGRARAIGVWGIGVADAHGGSGGAGGAGASATASNSLSGTTGTIVTKGLNGSGLIAQSIGGGGGSGGAAKSVSGGVVSVALAFGGSGGGGGAGGAATANASGNISTYGYDSIGVLSQSVGGGGGQGGTASAKSFSVGVPLGPDGPTLSAAVSVAHGGSGGVASAGGAASATNADSTSRVIGQTIQTSANQINATTGAMSLVTVEAGATYSGITTFGDNSTGVLVQSIGGGGGAAGDATANSSAGVLAKQIAKLQEDGEASDIESINVAVDVALGGTGGGGGAGGAASALNAGAITTFGLFADGMVAQSIGGGGGQGGSGNAKTSATGDISVGLNVAIGATGGAGGAGGAASGGNDGIIVTGGNNSRGILVQSIGAGGGNAGGGGGSTSSTFGLSIGLGSSGATGGAGGAATAWNYGAITTRGDWSDGITAQSIGGGGGNGGAGDSSLSITSSSKFNDSYSASGASSDTDSSTNGSQNKPTTDTFAMSLGTTGGGGGDAGAVVIGANKAASGISTTSAWAPKVGTSTIQTSGNTSHGMTAQSIGGGGGNAAISPASSSATATLNIGASGAGGGAGGNIFGYASNIATTGFSSHGLLAQSIGGGGGMGVAGGIATTINTRLGSENVALETGAGAGSSNNGGGVYVTTQAGSQISTGGPVTVADVTTNATDSFGLLAQSIGGGGGSAAAAMGSTTSSSGQGAQASHTSTLGGKPVGSTVGNDGGRVAVYHQGAIVTSGTRGFGIAAQSIGGGGGLVSGDANSLAGVTFTAGSTGNGGEVEVGLSNGATITTSGAGAFGVMAQSIGGGGGFAADASRVITAVPAGYSAGKGTGTGSGGDVYVTLGTGTRITTTGYNAHGVFAQSVTGGGGVWENKNEGMLAGTNRAIAASGATPSIVGVFVEGQVAVSGLDSWGVWAQNAGNAGNAAGVSVTVSGSVVASGQAYGAVAMSTDTGAGQLTIEKGGSVTGNVRNDGTTSSSASMQAFSVTDSLPPSSTGSLLNNGALTTADYVIGLDVTNTGTIDLGGTGRLGRTTFSGDLAGDGKIGVDVDLAVGRSDHLTVEGNTSGSQTLSLNALSLIKGGTAEFIRTLGDDRLSLAVEGDSLFSFELESEAGRHTVRASDADFTKAASRFGKNARAAAATLQDAWDISDATPARRAGVSMGKVFAQFNKVEKSELENRLLAIQSFSSTLGGSRAAQNAISAANEVMSCPVFEGDGLILSEGRCTWLRGAAGRSERDKSTDLPGYVENSTGISFGGQTEIAPDWFLGGNISTIDYDTTFSNGAESVSGNSLNVALSLKHQMGPWLFSGAIGGGMDDADSTRRIQLGDLSATASGAPDSNLIFARARVAYEVPYDRFYLRPTLDLDVVNFRRDGYSENGAGDLNLTVDNGSETFFAATPSLEVGGRIDYDNGNVMRIYGVAGVSFVNQDSYTASAYLAGAPDGELLDANSKVEDMVGRIGLNVELMTVGGFEFRAGYDLSAGDDITNQTGQIRVAYRF